MILKTLPMVPDFLEVAYLLIFGELPTATQLDKFQADINEEAIVDEDLKSDLKDFSKDRPPDGNLSLFNVCFNRFQPFIG